MAQLSVIIVNYNVRYFLEQTLRSTLRAMEGLDAEVWVVDNASADGSVEMVKNEFPEVKLIASKENLGFSKANNLAIRQCSGKYVLLLNPDTVVQEDTFRRCVDFMESHPSAGALGVRMIDGKGSFLPESKRGFPSPWVAFCKTFGLSKFFPKSRLFNQYHLGYLAEHENHEVDILSGAYMFMRKEALDKVGLLDEDYFMYGEDIDLSYRIQQGGYTNHYLADTTIIHYKGESTKRGSLNYVRVFYLAMIIFAQKHFQQQAGGKAYILGLRMAIWLRAFIQVLSNTWHALRWPIADGILLYGGLLLSKTWWEHYRYADEPAHFQPSLLTVNFPIYTGIWLFSMYFGGVYDPPRSGGRFLRSILVGSLLIAALYGFLDTDLRSSRMLIVLGTLWALSILAFVRILVNFMQSGNLGFNDIKKSNLMIVGNEAEADRVLRLLQRAEVPFNFLGWVRTNDITSLQSMPDALGHVGNLAELVHFYKPHEIIFCAADLSTQDIMRWMGRLGANIDFKILPEGSLSIIGSNSKNTAGDLYTVELRFKIDSAAAKRNKRTLDIVLCLFTLPLLPFWMLRKGYKVLSHWFSVILGKSTWVGYAPEDPNIDDLPKLRRGFFSPLSSFKKTPSETSTIHRLNMLYAKDYSTNMDIEHFLKGFFSIDN